MDKIRKYRKYSKEEFDNVMRLRAKRLSYVEIERRSGVPIDTFRNWFSRGNKPWSARASEENYRSYSREIPKEIIEKISISMLGPKNPMWKGDEATEGTLRWRLQRDMPVPKGCDRHHIDGNGKNSDPNNILVLARREHMIKDGRMEALIKRNKERWTPELREKISGENHHNWKGDEASDHAKYMREIRRKNRLRK